MKLGEIAASLDAELLGDPALEVTGMASLGSATAADLSFAVSEAHSEALRSSRAGAVILRASLSTLFDGPRLVVDDPYLAYARASAAFDTLLDEAPSVHASARVHDTAELGDGVYVGPNVVVERDARIGRDTRLMAGCFVGKAASVGERCLLHPNVVVYHDVHLGGRVIVHASSVLGSDGFGFAPDGERWRKIHQLGRVLVGDDVEIGAGTCIDRGALDDTVIEDGVVIDNLVHIAHNVRIGSGSAIAACVGIAGSTTIGRNCMIAGAVAINGHIAVGDGCRFNGGTVVTKSTEAGKAYASGGPMQEVGRWRRNAVRQGQLNELHRRVVALEKGAEG